MYNNKVIKILIIVIIFVLLNISFLNSSQIIFFENKNGFRKNENLVKISADFYGIKFKKIIIEKKEDLKKYFSTSEKTTIVLSSNVLTLINYNKLFKEIKNNKNIENNIFIIGINIKSDQNILNELSNNTVTGCDDILFKNSSGIYKIASNYTDISNELSGQFLHITGDNNTILNGLNVNKNFNTIISIVNNKNNNVFPYFGFHTHNGLNIFYVTDFKLIESYETSKQWKYDFSNYLEIIPFFMFVKYSFKEYALKSPNDFANFTIDDPWLIEPYGFLNYKDLLKEMKDNNFHTTIAFIPWNYKRNKTDVINIFKNNTDRYSICIHGNNHDHKEFSFKRDKISNKISEKSNKKMKYKVQQALKRMELFKEITGITYDKIMIFPHYISSEESFYLLKINNYLATCNSINIPIGAVASDEFQSRINVFNIEYSDFLSIKRFGTLKSSVIEDFKLNNNYKLIDYEFNIALQLFLDNPILFYHHHDIFKKNIKEFNLTANKINLIQPNVKWVNFGEILRNAYKIQKNLDGNYNIITYSKEIIFVNNNKVDTLYHIYKKESQSELIEKITINNKDVDYNISNKLLSTSIKLKPGDLAYFNIVYKNDFNDNDINPDKSNIKVTLLRKISDLRDLSFSKSAVGFFITNLYYKYGFYRLGLINIIIIICIILFIILLKRFIKKRNK